MDEYIDRTELIIQFDLMWEDIDPTRDELIDFIKQFKARDVAPVKHGYWVNGHDCSVCGAPIPTDSYLDYLDANDSQYCYSCGAKMYD